MEQIADIILDSLRGAVLVSGLVVVMMMMIESLNVGSDGRLSARLRGSRIGQVILSSFLGVVPGCMGGFATVSLYTHNMVSFGSLAAMMIASSGDEAFVMLAMFPDKALWIFLFLFGAAIATGLLTDLFIVRRNGPRAVSAATGCDFSCKVADHRHSASDSTLSGRHFSRKRLYLLLGTGLFIAALVTGLLEHEHANEDAHHAAAGINLLSEDWMNVLFGILSLLVIVVIIRGSDHFVEEHLWHHIVCRHLPRIFLWTLSVLIICEVLTSWVDVSAWISGNTVLMIVLASLIGIIPESGPHLIFVTLYASGIVPLPVLLASCISQDGHAGLPLLAESKSDFVKAKAIGCAVALVVALAAHFILFT